jgi:UDP-N-acetylmuramoyl-L-alanyl-D-glutamate--2,6-diaminopimelate ligase
VTAPHVDETALPGEAHAALALLLGLAIARAVELTKPGGAVLWCGPGHLKYREVKGQKLPFDAVKIAREVLGDD